MMQLNLQPHFGGGEVYTAFLCRALDQLGVVTELVAHEKAAYWPQLNLPASTRIHRVGSAAEARDIAGAAPAWILGHGPLPAAFLERRAPTHLLTAIAHMPVQGRNPRSFDGHDQVFPVSGWVRDGLLTVGAPVWQEPLLGVADLSHRPASGRLLRRSRYDWDQRKGRDRLLGLLEPLVERWRAKPVFKKRPGLTLGVVSRLTPIKQFPLLFSCLAPVLARHSEVNVEIFGSGGYASVRDLDRALAPLGERVRFWGQQADVRAVYGQLDYLMTGLPEKEALGLNVIEAQGVNLPVLAVRAAPFTETVAEGRTGWFYTDPRQDQGVDFSRVLDRLGSPAARLQPAQAADHLAQFSFDAFVKRIERVVVWARQAASTR